MRTTITLDLPLLRKIREIGHRERKTFTQVVQELLLLAIGLRDKRMSGASPLGKWHSKEMGTRVDYRDKEALYRTLDRSA